MGCSWNCAAVCHGDLLQLVNTCPSGVRIEMEGQDGRMQKPLERAGNQVLSPVVSSDICSENGSVPFKLSSKTLLWEIQYICPAFLPLSWSMSLHGVHNHRHPGPISRGLCSLGKSLRPLSLPLVHGETDFWCPRLLRVVSHESIKNDC